MPPLVLLALLASACSTAGGSGGSGAPVGATTAVADGSGSSTTPASSPSPTSTAASEPGAPPPQARDAITHVDLGSARWYDLEEDRSITLHRGTAKADGYVWTLGKKPRPVYADANGDGYLDAMAILERMDGRAWSFGYYVWLWDPAANRPRQLRDLVAASHPCGDAVTGVKPVSGRGFQLSEQLRAKYDGDCASGGSVKSRRTVVVQDGGLVQVAPYRGYGGVCAVPSDEGVTQPDAGKLTIRVAPRSSGGRAVSPSKVVVLAGADSPDAARTWPGGWVQVSFLTKAMKDAGLGDRPPCGFIKPPGGAQS